MCAVVLENPLVTIQDIDSKIALVNLDHRYFLDDQAAKELGEELSSLVLEGKNKIMINWERVEFLGPLVIHELIGFSRKIQKVRGRMVFYAVCKEVYDVFAMTKLTNLFIIVEDEQIALQSLSL